MQTMAPSMLLLALFCGAAMAAEVTPTEKVISLLDGMLEKGKKEKHDEQVAFNSYKQFCEDTSTEKTRAITEAEELIASLKADIEKYAADAARLTKEIAGHEADLTAWTGDKEAATKVRNMEKALFDKTHKDYSESIDALGRAIDVLKAQLTKSKIDSDTGSFMQLSEVSDLQSLSLIPPQAKQAINAFLSTDSEENLALGAAPEATAYDFQSNNIIEMLEKLLSKFTDEKTELMSTEEASVHAYKLLMTDLTANMDLATSDIKEKTKFKASCLEKKADCEGNVADTTATKTADEQYLADLTATCKTKATDFETRQELRAGEIEAIEKAIEILSSDSVLGKAQKHLPTMIQQGPHMIRVQGDHMVSALAQLRSDSQSNTQARVVHFLQQQAKELHSRVLTVAAERAASDPFKKVKKMISDLIDKLMAEASEEADAKGYCDQELATNEQTRKQKTESVETTHAEIDELTATIAKLEGQLADLAAGIAALDAAMAEATQIRLDEKDKNTVTIADAKEAQAATAKAIGVLKEFYAKAAESTALVQEHEDPTIFESKYTGMQSENGGVVGMLEVIETDFARLEADTSSAETSAKAEYDKFMADSKFDKKSKAKDIEHKDQKKLDTKQSLILAKEDLAGTQEELKAALDYYDKLKPACLDSGVDYEDRVARRKQELESLQKALDILSGEAI